MNTNELVPSLNNPSSVYGVIITVVQLGYQVYILRTKHDL